MCVRVFQSVSIALQPVVNELVVEAVSASNPDLGKAMPRRRSVIVAPTAAAPAPDGWSLAKSVFASFKDETPQLQRKVFDADWSHTKVERIIKDEAELHRVRDVMRKHYYEIRCIFKYYCTLDAGGDAYAMSWNSFTTFMTQIRVPDDNCKLDVRVLLLPTLLLQQF